MSATWSINHITFPTRIIFIWFQSAFFFFMVPFMKFYILSKEKSHEYLTKFVCIQVFFPLQLPLSMCVWLGWWFSSYWGTCLVVPFLSLVHSAHNPSRFHRTPTDLKLYKTADRTNWDQNLEYEKYEVFILHISIYLSMVMSDVETGLMWEVFLLSQPNSTQLRVGVTR